MKLLDLLIGRKLANREGESEKITAIEGVPAMGLDGLASSAYGPEAALTMLAPLGVMGLAYMGPVMLAVLAVLAILYVSYWQTIEAYPTSGGSYTVAHENLGANAGLLAATALMIDYVLNVAVGISAGVGALTSAVPALHPYTLWLCLGILVFVTLINLRGIFEAGLVFAVPTYLFVLSFGGCVVVYGVWQALMAGGDPMPVVPPPAAPAEIGAAVSVWLLLRAFASAYHTLAMDQSEPGYQSILSQLSAAVLGRGPLYFVAMSSVLAVLCLSANTSFAGFPRLCRQVARDEYLPRAFAISGRRLVNSVGILWLAGTAAILLVVFDGITDRLIPLFAVGAFLSFTLSQAGMAVHWSRQLSRNSEGGGRLGHRARLGINATGALATGASLAVILVAKFVEGAWITVLTIPFVLALLKLTKRYYTQIDRQLIDEGPIALDDLTPPIVIVPIRDWNRLAERAVRYALRLSSEVIAVHLTRLEGPDGEEDAERLRRRWEHEVERPARAAGLKPPRLMQTPSPYRSIVAPLLKFVLQIRKASPNRAITVVIPALVEAHWWDHLMHTRRAHRLRQTLMRHGGPQLAVVLVPWTLEEPKPEAVIAAEEPRHQAARAAERQPEQHAAK